MFADCDPSRGQVLVHKGMRINLIFDDYCFYKIHCLFVYETTLLIYVLLSKPSPCEN